MADTNQSHQDHLIAAAGELTSLIYEGNVAAVGIVIIMRENSLARTISRAEDGYHFHLIAGAAHLQHDLLHASEVVNTPNEGGANG